ncbi:hypothetical protein BO86DRAFT_327880 [Aspergillus japonicus CBS 114.51]|uniref:Uncharacterized protein n=1 Tax=Aspergillus japonicus CBS 114.51 TaxID=1448312 RepID=A0A8T8XHJ5_ASPJA|nr:hypothetical protein BO86DRAFT_327880 [Aspergillus japonicus CBS 114.51]RAH87501.1 hypothetical protein BO86DRAFT_327880 [Aspergillus japonicus CBS 114.51]
MKFINTILTLFVFIRTMHCAPVSSAYEALFFYYAYQIDAAAAARAAADGVPWTQTIGQRCIGADCSFVAFVQSIMKEDAAAELTPTALGDTTSPNVYNTAQDIIENWNYDYKQLVADNIITGKNKPWSVMITAIVDKVQAARAVVPSADLVQKCTTALRWAQAARLTDMVGDVMADPLTGERTKAFIAEFKDVDLEAITRTLGTDQTDSESRAIEFLDLDYEGMAGGDADQLAKFMAWTETTPSKKEFPSYRRHREWALLYDEKATVMETGCSN